MAPPPVRPISSGLAKPFFLAWISMLIVLLGTRALIPVARSPHTYPAWYFEPIRDASLLAAIVGTLLVIAIYAAVGRRFVVLGEHGPIIVSAAFISGLGCALVVFGVEHGLGEFHQRFRDYSPLLSAAGQITAAILIAFVIERRFAPERGRVTELDVIGFAYITTSLGTAILGSYPVSPFWQASLGVVSCMGAGAGIAALALRASELSVGGEKDGKSL